MDLYTTAKLLQLPEPTWLIERLYPTGSLVVLYGPSGHYKSFLALDWSLHIATGQSWQGLQVQQGPVIYIAAEGRGGLAQRVDAWLSHYHVVNPPIFFGLEPVDMLDDGPEELIDACREVVYDPEEEPSDLYPALIVIDTLARCFGGDENETADMARFVAGIDLLRQELHATVLVVHHVGKDWGRGERGSSVLRGAADTMIRASKQGSSEEQKTILMKCSKQKDAVEFEDIELRLTSNGDKCIITPGWSIEAAIRSVQKDQTLTSIRAQARAMADLTGLPIETCRNRLRTLARPLHS